MCSGDGRRVFHAVPVIYKGSGFYTTDYGRPKTPSSESKEKEASGSSENKSAGSNGDSSESDSKTDAQSDSRNGSTDKAVPESVT